MRTELDKVLKGLGFFVPQSFAFVLYFFYNVEFICTEEFQHLKERCK